MTQCVFQYFFQSKKIKNMFMASSQIAKLTMSLSLHSKDKIEKRVSSLFFVLINFPNINFIQWPIYQIVYLKQNLMISQIFFLSARGDSIINRDFRSDLIKNTPELFYRKVKMAKGDAQPIFNIQGINFAYLKKSSLYIVATTRFNVSPAYILELLNKIIIVIKDFCGVITEEAIRKNFVLIYEILDQIIDFGYPQLTNTSHIKPLIASQVVQQKQSVLKNFGSFSLFTPQTVSSQASSVSISKNKSNEIFVDVFEKLNILFNSSGYIINSSIDGYIQMKSYLTGNPALKLALNQDLTVADSNSQGSIILDDCNFHECVNHGEFLLNKNLKITPPQGQFVVMNYRITNDFPAPFKVMAFFQIINPYKIQLIVKLKSIYPKETLASSVTVKFSVPKGASGITPEIIKNPGNQKAQYNQTNSSVEWVIKKMPGDAQYVLSTKITLPQATSSQAQKQTGPISLNFQIPNFNVSNIQIKSLKVLQGNQNPIKWVRYITKSSSYVCRI